MQKKIESGIFLGVFQSLIIMECCSCRRVIGYKDGFGVDGVSHGYCPDCEAQLKAVIASKKQEFDEALILKEFNKKLENLLGFFKHQTERG